MASYSTVFRIIHIQFETSFSLVCSISSKLANHSSSGAIFSGRSFSYVVRRHFQTSFYPPNLVIIAYIFSELRRERGRGWNPPSGRKRPKTKPGLNRVKLFGTSSTDTVLKESV